jgi:hypothetical protein
MCQTPTSSRRAIATRAFGRPHARLRPSASGLQPLVLLLPVRMALHRVLRGRHHGCPQIPPSGPSTPLRTCFGDAARAVRLAAVVYSRTHASIADQMAGIREALDGADGGQDRDGDQRGHARRRGNANSATTP